MAELTLLSRPPSSSSSRLVGSRAPFHLPVTSSLPSFLVDLPSSSASSSLPSKLPLSRQPSMDPSSFLLSSSSSTLPLFSRQASFSTSTYPYSLFSLEDDGVDSFPLSSSSSSSDDDDFSFLKASADFSSFDLTHRISSTDSEISSWSSSDGSANTPMSPHSSAESLSDSSQSTEAEMFAAAASSYPHIGQGKWVQPTAQRPQLLGKGDDYPSFPPLLGALPELQRSMSAASLIPVLPQAFTQPVYAFNYHHAEEEANQPSRPSPSSRHERREGLRGGGHGRSSYHRSDAEQSEGEQQPADHDSRRESVDSTRSLSSTAGHAPASPSMGTSTVSPKSLLLNLAAARTAAASSSSSSSHSHSSHYSTSSSSSLSPSPASYLDPNEVVIGIYTRAERAAKIARYREKRANRQWKKKIMYNCRKSFADNRPRVGGRFIKMKQEEADNQAKKGAK